MHVMRMCNIKKTLTTIIHFNSYLTIIAKCYLKLSHFITSTHITLKNGGVYIK